LKNSKHLLNIMHKKNSSCNMQVVFLNIEKFSMRVTHNQIEVLNSFTNCLHHALNEVAKEYIEYAYANGLNFLNDTIFLSSGDGAAAIFTFDGLYDIHLAFARKFLQVAHVNIENNPCEKFTREGWCNCHDKFNLNIGISEGKGIIFKDINGRVNVAGNTVNMAARVMDLGERNHIIFSDNAFAEFLEMTPNMNNRFVEFRGIEIKHGLKIKVYQYVEPSCVYLNSEPPSDIAAKHRMHSITEKFSAGLRFPVIDLEQIGREDIADQLESITNTISGFGKVISTNKSHLLKNQNTSKNTPKQEDSNDTQ